MTRTQRWLVALVALGVLLAACGGAEDSGEAGADDAAADEADAEAGADAGATTEAADGAQVAGCDAVDLSDPPDQPVTIRIGHGRAAEEPFWLMTADESLTEHEGAWYEMELVPFRGTEERLQAYQAGELDAVIISPQAQIRGEAAQALDLYAIVTVMREAEPDAFSTSFIALEDSGITSPEDLEGKRIAIVDVGSQLDFLARMGVEEGGYDPDTGAEYVVFPFPAQEDALRGGQIDVAGLPEPLYSLAKSNGGTVDVFDAADLTEFAYDLLTLSFDRTFVEENIAAVCAWRDDYQAAMEFYRSNKEEARRTLAGTDFITLPEDAYLMTGDYARPEGGVVDTEGMEQMLDVMIEQDILTEDDRIDPGTLVRPGVSAGH